MNQYGIFCSSEMKKVYNIAVKFAHFPTTVLIEGETGVGKEVVANLIHKNSPRSNMPFIKVNCAAIPETLLDSELFGYERGAFTGANTKGHSGLFESADKGTLLLDEVGELSPLLQVKLLRVLQEREVRRIGGSWSKPVDVRIISCTNKNLWEAVKKKDFRIDLFYRLNIAKIKIPPLRKRKDDILPLVNYFLRELYKIYKVRKTFNNSALNLIQDQKFYGNIRELKNIVEVAYITADSDVITIEDLPSYLVKSNVISTRYINYEINKNITSLQDMIQSFEKKIISDTLQSSDSIRKAASKLGISHPTLLRRIKRYNLQELVGNNTN